LQLRNAEADEQFWTNIHDMHAGTVEDHKGLAATAERKVAEGEAEMAKAASHRDAAKDRRERLQRGEDVPGGLGKPLTREDAERFMREAGMTMSDIQHCGQVHDVSEAIGFETLMKAIHDATHRAERNVVRGFHRLIDFDEPPE
jgi:hypothetical protein